MDLKKNNVIQSQFTPKKTNESAEGRFVSPKFHFLEILMLYFDFSPLLPFGSIYRRGTEEK